MLVSLAERVIAEDGDDAAVGDPAAAALVQHSGQLQPQCLQAGDPALDLVKLTLSNGVDGLTWFIGIVHQAQQIADRLQRKAQLTRMTDERQPVDIRLAIEALVTLRTDGLRQQADLLVIADGLDLAASGAGEAADGVRRGHHQFFPLNLQLL